MPKLCFYCSAMNAGKTTAPLWSAHNCRERGMRVASRRRGWTTGRGLAQAG